MTPVSAGGNKQPDKHGDMGAASTLIRAQLAPSFATIFNKAGLAARRGSQVHSKEEMLPDPSMHVIHGLFGDPRSHPPSLSPR